MTRIRNRLVPLLVFVIVVMGGSITPVNACSVCFSENGYLARYAYYSTTLALILLPAGLVTGFALWIRSAESHGDDGSRTDRT